MGTPGQSGRAAPASSLLCDPPQRLCPGTVSVSSCGFSSGERHRTFALMSSHRNSSEDVWCQSEWILFSLSLSVLTQCPLAEEGEGHPRLPGHRAVCAGTRPGKGLGRTPPRAAGRGSSRLPASPRGRSAVPLRLWTWLPLCRTCAAAGPALRSRQPAGTSSDTGLTCGWGSDHALCGATRAPSLTFWLHASCPKGTVSGLLAVS